MAKFCLNCEANVDDEKEHEAKTGHGLFDEVVFGADKTEPVKSLSEESMVEIMQRFVSLERDLVNTVHEVALALNKIQEQQEYTRQVTERITAIEQLLSKVALSS